MVREGFKSIDFGIVVILVFVFFGKHPFVFSKLVGMLDFFIFQCFFESMSVKSYPFEELLVNLASWTPQNFGKYPKSPK